MITKECKYCNEKFKQYASGDMQEGVKRDIINHYDRWHKSQLFDLIINDMEECDI